MRCISSVMSMHRVRVHLRFVSDHPIEAYFSEKLTLKENIDLLYSLLGKDVKDYLVMPYDTPIILDPLKKLSAYHLQDATILYIYDFTKEGSCIKITP